MMSGFFFCLAGEAAGDRDIGLPNNEDAGDIEGKGGSARSMMLIEEETWRKRKNWKNWEMYSTQLCSQHGPFWRG